jgi:hypothetical protein
LIKHIYIFTVLAAFVLQLGSRLYVIVDFKLNQDYIAENLCEKKDEPESCCEGSCQLSKELNKIEESEEQGPLNNDNQKKQKTEEFPLFISDIKQHEDLNMDEIQILEWKVVPCSSGFYSEIFHPPAV